MILIVFQQRWLNVTGFVVMTLFNVEYRDFVTGKKRPIAKQTLIVISYIIALAVRRAQRQ